ncbi:D-tyrosyl-tRNA(Tyr) deacylase [Rhodobacteraceae bacterium]|nr:D-tyrosyl-tRNA(Tyr) deacylase [Paracoccaceae bacterium]
MRALLQRVSEARVRVEDTLTGEIGPGLLILVCAMQGDTEAEAEKLAQRISKLRIFKDDAGKMNRSVLDSGGACLVVSQFTLAADTRSGNRPGFSSAAAPELGKHLYEHFSTALRTLGLEVAQGIFAADMAVSLTNDGPITIWMDTDKTERTGQPA